MAEQYDVIVVGGGLVGTSLAAALGGSSLQVAIIEPKPEGREWDRRGFDSRVCALTPSTRDWLAELDAWKGIENERYAAFDDVRVWDGDGTASVHFSAAEVGVDHLGYIVENRVTVQALSDATSRFRNIEWIRPDSVATLDAEYPPTIQLRSGRELTASLVVGADGALSHIRRLAGYHLAEWDYGHSAIVTTVHAERPHLDWALHRFSADGPLAFLPLPDPDGNAESHYYSIVWCDSPARVAQWMKLEEPDLRRILERQFESRVGTIEQIAKCASFPLRQRHALGYAKPGFALIGDAAHTIHPLAGQGVNLGFQDARALARAILSAMDEGREIGEMRALNRFQLRRIAPNAAMAGLMEGFKQLFALQDPRIRWLRNEGIRLFDRQTFAKREIVRLVLGV